MSDFSAILKELSDSRELSIAPTRALVVNVSCAQRILRLMVLCCTQAFVRRDELGHPQISLATAQLIEKLLSLAASNRLTLVDSFLIF